MNRLAKCDEWGKWTLQHCSGCGLDTPRKRFVDAVDGAISDAGQNLSQIGFGTEVVEFRRADQTVDGPPAA